MYIHINNYIYIYVNLHDQSIQHEDFVCHNQHVTAALVRTKHVTAALVRTKLKAS